VGSSPALEWSELLAPEPRRPCLGCGLRPVKGRTYCRDCKYRLAHGLPVDLESWPTVRDCRRARPALFEASGGAPEPRELLDLATFDAHPAGMLSRF